MILIAAILSCCCLIVILWPFFDSKGGVLSEGFFETSADIVEKKMALIVARYVQDEQDFKDHKLSNFEWKSRQSFLMNRYVDLARRYEFINKK